MKLFSKLDLEFIYRSLGRKPNKKELIVLHDVLEPVLMQRKLLPARFVKQIGRIKITFTLKLEMCSQTETGAQKTFYSEIVLCTEVGRFRYLSYGFLNHRKFALRIFMLRKRI